MTNVRVFPQKFFSEENLLCKSKMLISLLTYGEYLCMTKPAQRTGGRNKKKQVL